MTPNVTRVVIDAARGQEAGPTSYSRILLADTLFPVFGFAVSAIVAGIGYQHGSFWTWLFPIILLVILALRVGPRKCAVDE